MKKNNTKGFTLVELLAVIVILAIILLIAVPNVMGIIENAKKDGFCSTAKLAYKSVEYFKLQESDLVNNLSSGESLVITFTADGSEPTVINSSDDTKTSLTTFTNLDGYERFESGAFSIAQDGTISVSTNLVAAEGGYVVTAVTTNSCTIQD